VGIMNRAGHSGVLTPVAVLILLAGCGAEAPPPAASAPPASAAPSSSGADDGGLVTYQAVYPDGVDIGRMRLDGTEAERLPVADYERWHPRWSPDGTLIVYDRWYPEEEKQHIAVVAPDGSGDRFVVECVSPCLAVEHPAWSPDGRAIAFAGVTGQEWDGPDMACQLGLVDVASGDVTHLLPELGCEFSYMAPHFSPDGTRIVFKRIDETARRAALFTVAVDGSDLQQLTDWGLGARPDWSPDGDWIVFMDVEHAPPFGQVHLYRIRADGTDLQQLTDMPGSVTGDVFPRWLPDSSAILFSRCDGGFDCETRLISPDGSGDRLLVSQFGRQVHHVMLQPTSLIAP
jgi:Tol biopolymer transport system component